MRFVLEMDCDNAAFEPEPEVEIGRILGRLAEHIAAFGAEGGSVRDVNGNTVGAYLLDRTGRGPITR